MIKSNKCAKPVPVCEDTPYYQVNAPLIWSCHFVEQKKLESPETFSGFRDTTLLLIPITFFDPSHGVKSFQELYCYKKANYLPILKIICHLLFFSTCAANVRST